MPCPHNEITIVQRSQRQSAVAAAAYQSGEKLFCEYDQQVKHYPEKRGIVHNEILLPANAPRSYADRNTVATHFSCPIITLVVCHRINRYNDMGTEKGKGFRTLIFCTELSPETITKTMVIISKYEVEYKETEDIFNRQ